MSKARKDAKKHRQAVEEAKKVTTGKILRIALKVFILSILFTFALALAEAYLGWKITNNIWVQAGLMLIIVIVAQPFIMREFRPKK